MTTDKLEGLEARIISMITEEITYNATVEPDTDLLLSGLVDSLGVIRIVVWLEETLDVEIDPVDVVLENFQSVAQIVDYADRRMRS